MLSLNPTQHCPTGTCYCTGIVRNYSHHHVLLLRKTCLAIQPGNCALQPYHRSTEGEAFSAVMLRILHVQPSS